MPVKLHLFHEHINSPLVTQAMISSETAWDIPT